MLKVLSGVQTDERDLVHTLRAIERQVLWTATWMIHHANHIRPSRDGLKVGGHQASSASLATIMTVLYFSVLRAQDRVAVKPHASPIFHAIQYLAERQSLEKLQRFRAFDGAQSYPSRTKDSDDVDFSTGSVGLGVAATLFASLVQDYVAAHSANLVADPLARMVALVGDAELDEGNVYEALLEGWKHDLRNTWWIIDYNRQSLDGAVRDALFNKISGIFGTLGWNVTTLKYGAKLTALATVRGGDAVLDWIDRCDNQLYSALTFKGGAAWRTRLRADLGDVGGVKAILDDHDDAALQALMTNLGGHDIETLLTAFQTIAPDPRPQCIIAYTIKGFGLPLAGHKDNHAGLLTPTQMAELSASLNVATGAEWDRFCTFGNDRAAAEALIKSAPILRGQRRRAAPRIETPEIAAPRTGERASTQETFGKILLEVSRGDSAFSNAIVTTSPDVTVSTNLGGWVNRRHLFNKTAQEDLYKTENVPSAQIWKYSPRGQHLELGIAEHNLFLLLGQLGLAHDFFGKRLLPIGTLYDPFINRGLDALNYACYQGARFIVAATPSGLTLGPEGGAHQSIHPPVIAMAQPKMTYIEPSYADEVAAAMSWAFNHIQEEDGGAVYLRLSTRAIAQEERNAVPAGAITNGAYWLRQPGADARLAIAYCGAMAPEALEAWETARTLDARVGLLAMPSPSRAYRHWTEAQHAEIRDEVIRPAPIERLLASLHRDARIVTVIDGAPQTLSWLGGVCGHRTTALGVSEFGQSGDLCDLYDAYNLSAAAIFRACEQSFLP